MADYSISLSQVRDHSNTSDEEEETDRDSRSPRTAPQLIAGSVTLSGGSGGGAGGGGEYSARKPRGRPPGSKNKPKPPIVITRESENSMKPAVLEISPGSDIIEMVVQFARRRHLGLTVLSCSGSVSNVTLRHPGSHAPSLTLHGPFYILSLTGSLVGYSSSSAASPSSSASASCMPSSSWSFAITLSGLQGQLLGGIVAGKVTAASPVLMLVSTFRNPTFHSLPSELEELENQPNPSGGGGNNNGGTAAASEGGGGGASPGMAMSPYSVSAAATPLSSCQVSSDNVLPWNPTTSLPTSRPPPHF